MMQRQESNRTESIAATQEAIQRAQAAQIMTQTNPTTCQKCGKRPGTERFATDQTAFTHGWVQMWCVICVLEAQIKHAKERARKLPAMERKLARLKAREARKKAR